MRTGREIIHLMIRCEVPRHGDTRSREQNPAQANHQQSNQLAVLMASWSPSHGHPNAATLELGVNRPL
jgi:hypothetical protein